MEKHDSELARRFKQNPGVFIGTIIVLVIIIIAFVLVPAIVPSAGGRDTDLTFGYYDKVPISYAPGNFLADYRDMLARYRQSSMNSENTPYINYQIWREAFEATVIHTAMLREMHKAGYAAPEKVVDRNVARRPEFQENGRFSPALYRQWDDNQRLALWRQVREETTTEHFRSDVMGLLAPSAEGVFLGRMAAVQRSFDMAVFPVDAYPESEYAAYIQEHPELFRFIHLSIITVNSSEREARQILAAVKSGGTTFEDAARSYSKDAYADRGGDMGIKMLYEIAVDVPSEEARGQLAALARGEYSDIIKNDSSWTFFHVNEALQDSDAGDPAVMEKVRSYVRSYEGGRMENWATAQADRFIARVNEVGFDDALAERAMYKRSFGPIPLNYGSIDLFTTLSSQSVTELAAAANNEFFWKAAFRTPVESPSKPVVQGSNVLVLYVKEETASDAETIERVVSIHNSGDWLEYVSGMSLQQHIMNSPKLEDNFLDIYFRYFTE